MLFNPTAILSSAPPPGGSDATVSFVATSASITTISATSYTHTAVALGSGAYVAVAIGGLGASGTFTSITVGGNSAVVVSNGTASNYAAVAIIANPNPGGTADIVITRSANLTRHYIATYAVDNISSTTATDNDFTGTWTSNTASVTSNVPAGGIAIGVAFNTGTISNTFTWTGLNEDADVTNFSGRSFTFASLASSAGNATLAVSAAASGTNTGSLLVATFDN